METNETHIALAVLENLREDLVIATQQRGVVSAT
jgi:hypothetical protein